MEQMSAREIQKALAQPFAPEDLEWRLQRTIEEKACGLAVPYVTNRAIQNRLDDVVGPENWYNDYKPWHTGGKKDAQICGISIYFEGRGFITKWDGAENTDIEPIKGGLSDSMKRAAVQWGIGRVLYNMDSVWVDIEKRGKTWFIKNSERQKLTRAYINLLDELHLTPAKPGSTEAQLIPKDTAEGTKNRGQTPPTPQQSGAAQPTAPKPAPAPPCIYEYKVAGIKVQGGMSGSSTLVELEAPDEKRIQAFARGARPELAAGTLLTGVKLSVRQQDTVAFYVLEAYEIVTPQQRAA